MDWASVDYNANLQCADPPCLFDSIDVRGEYEYFTPRVNLNYYFSTGQVVPYVRAGIGYAFIDTNIPTGQVEVGCWWDPWYGQICTTWQSTRSADAFTYGAGLGLRWDASDSLSVKFAYEKHWVDIDTADSAPDPDQFKIGVSVMY